MDDKIVKVSINSIAPIVEDKIRDGKCVEITVTGMSMYPLFYNARDTVTLAPIKKIKRKGIYFYKREDGTYVLHRIIKIKGGEYFCVGDNQTYIEGPLKEDQFIAVVESFIRKGKKKSVKSLWFKVYSFVWCFSVKARPKLLRFIWKITGRKK